MTWLILALLAATLSGFTDFFIKLSAGKIHATFSGFVINLVSTLVLLPFIFCYKAKGENIFKFGTNGLAYSIIAGIIIGFLTIVMLKMYSQGTNLSIGSPLIRIGSVVLVISLGILFLKEPITLKFVVGFLLSLAGLYLLVGK